MSLLPDVYILSYILKEGELPQTPIGTHRSVEAALEANEKHFGLPKDKCVAYCKTGLLGHIAVMLTPGWYRQKESAK